jgi:hypothetical protein
MVYYLLDGYFFGVECCQNDGVKTIGWNSFNPSVGLACFWQRMELGAILHNTLIEQLGLVYRSFSVGKEQGFFAADYIRACYVT